MRALKRRLRIDPLPYPSPMGRGVDPSPEHVATAPGRADQNSRAYCRVAWRASPRGPKRWSRLKPSWERGLSQVRAEKANSPPVRAGAAEAGGDEASMPTGMV